MEMGMQMDVLGWQATRWGMTSEEIISIVGSANIRRGNRKQYKGSYAELTIPDVKIETFPFDVIFQMADDNDRLHQVLITHDDLDLADPQRAFEAARRMLTERFGKPERVGTTDAWLWAFKSTYIYLEKIYLPDIVGSAYIRFRPANRADQPTISAF